MIRVVFPVSDGGLGACYLPVVGQVKSYVMPLVIMAPIPLTVIGVMPGHALVGSIADPDPHFLLALGSIVIAAPFQNGYK